jgi:hypothetical protein
MVKDVVNNLMFRMLDEGIVVDDVLVVGLTNGRRSLEFRRPRMKAPCKTSAIGRDDRV